MCIEKCKNIHTHKTILNDNALVAHNDRQWQSIFGTLVYFLLAWRRNNTQARLHSIFERVQYASLLAILFCVQTNLRIGVERNCLAFQVVHRWSCWHGTWFLFLLLPVLEGQSGHSGHWANTFCILLPLLCQVSTAVPEWMIYLGEWESIGFAVMLK